jgi:hypothetical protein
MTDALDVIRSHLADAIPKLLENWSRPAVLFKPSLRYDNGWWDVHYGGEYLGTGVTPEAAMANFDVNWRAGTLLQPRQ